MLRTHTKMQQTPKSRQPIFLMANNAFPALKSDGQQIHLNANGFPETQHTELKLEVVYLPSACQHQCDSTPNMKTGDGTNSQLIL